MKEKYLRPFIINTAKAAFIPYIFSDDVAANAQVEKIFARLILKKQKNFKDISKFKGGCNALRLVKR